MVLDTISVSSNVNSYFAYYTSSSNDVNVTSATWHARLGHVNIDS